MSQSPLCLTKAVQWVSRILFLLWASWVMPWRDHWCHHPAFQRLYPVALATSGSSEDLYNSLHSCLDFNYVYSQRYNIGFCDNCKLHAAWNVESPYCHVWFSMQKKKMPSYKSTCCCTFTKLTKTNSLSKKEKAGAYTFSNSHTCANLSEFMRFLRTVKLVNFCTTFAPTFIFFLLLNLVAETSLHTTPMMTIEITKLTLPQSRHMFLKPEQAQKNRKKKNEIAIANISHHWPAFFGTALSHFLCPQIVLTHLRHIM